jgi:uncharacterized protein YlxW (UPF0749 family)
MRPALSRGHLLAGALCAVLGFALVVQVRQTQSSTIGTLRQGDLIGLLQNVTTQSARLDAQALTLESQLGELRSGSDRAAVAEKVATEKLEVYEILAGTKAVVGPGIQLDISDGQRAVSAAMVLDTVQELRGAGAEAIQCGDVRVVVDTAFVDDAEGRGVVADGRLLEPPYRFLAIGDAASLDRALSIPGGILETLHARGASGLVTQRTSIRVSAVHEPSPARYARPPEPSATP